MGYYVGRELWIMEQHSRNPIAVYDERGYRYSVYWHLGGYFGISEGKVVWQSTNNYILLRSDVPVKDGSLSIDIILENGSKLTNEIDNIYYPWVRIPLPKIVTQGGGKPSGQGVNYNDQYAGAVEKLAGKPYVLGADGPKAYDCSSTACYGIRTVANPKFGDYTAHDLYKKFSVPSSSKTRGSVIFYDYTSDGRIDHVTTILNSSNMLHPSSGAGVLQIKPINYLDSYTNNRGGTIYYREFNWLIINKTP